MLLQKSFFIFALWMLSSSTSFAFVMPGNQIATPLAMPVQTAALPPQDSWTGAPLSFGPTAEQAQIAAGIDTLFSNPLAPNAEIVAFKQQQESFTNPVLMAMQLSVLNYDQQARLVYHPGSTLFPNNDHTSAGAIISTSPASEKRTPSSVQNNVPKANEAPPAIDGQATVAF